jgi:hypothetical protein
VSVQILSPQKPRSKRMPKYIQAGAKVSMSGNVGTVLAISGAHVSVLFADRSELTTHYTWLSKAPKYQFLPSSDNGAKQ